MRSYSDGSETASFQYDPFGRRIEMTVNRATTYYLYGASNGGHPIAEDIGGVWYREAIMDGVHWGSMQQNGDGGYTLPDALGSTAVFAQDGTVQPSRLYPFGEEAQTTSAEYKWTNQIRDGNSLDHFAFRTYASNLARWLSPDPAGLAAVNPADPQSWNRYAYVENRPLSHVDPNGTVTTDEEEARLDAYLEGLQWELAGGSGGGCSMEGIGIGCGLTNEELSFGMAQECPNDDCGIGASKPYTCVGSVCGYMTIQYATAHENDVNGQLLTDAEYQTYLIATSPKEIGEQRSRLDGNLALDFPWKPTTGAVVVINGSNVNFQCPACPAPGRYDSGVHVEPDGTVHDDTASPCVASRCTIWNLNWVNAIIHIVVDYIGGGLFNGVFPR